MLKLFKGLFFFVFLTSPYISQEDWDFGDDSDNFTLNPSFNDTRVVNGHSVEVLEEKTLDLRISHRFGSIAVPNAGRTLFGFDNSTDIRIGLEYGITDKLMVGAGRSKGAFPLTEVWDGLAKYKILDQSKKIPFSLCFSSSIFATSMAVSLDSSAINSFQQFSHRLSYYSQLILAYNLKNLITIQLAPGLLHRNYVLFEDQNTNFVIGAMTKVKLYKKVSLVAEYYHIMRKTNIINYTEYLNPLAFSVEIKTHAHVFQLNFTNSRGIGEGQFIPYTKSSWLDGEFRFGFTISRHF
jgi:hypothetical protein